MNDGYIRAAAAAPAIEAAGCSRNTDQIIDCLRQAGGRQVKLLVLPELCITGYALGDLFAQQALLDAAERELGRIVAASRDFDLLLFAGLPVRQGGRLYNCAAAVQGGRLLGVVPKSCLPNYSEFYEVRHFAPGTGTSGTVRLAGFEAPFGTDLLFRCDTLPGLCVGAEICEDLWVPVPPSSLLAQAGATVLVNLSASTYVTGKEGYRRNLVASQSGRCVAGYVFASAGRGESSTDLVFSGHLMIAENGKMLGEAHADGGLICTDIDVEMLESERRKTNTFAAAQAAAGKPECRTVHYSTGRVRYAPLLRPIERQPFVPAPGEKYRERCREVLDIQCAGLAKRLGHTRAKAAVIAVSGGLDSTLALLVIDRAIRKYDIGCRVVAITMPGPGTTARTKGNAGSLCEAIGAELRTIPIAEAVTVHLRDIGHDSSPDTTFENAQARERMQIAMSVANMTGGLVVGTGDMSELALGFTTYNGDHMSMYGVNAGVPKTLVRHLIRYIADERADNQLLHDTLYDILDTPVSPELLPAVDGKIAQQTEQILGPYELHDFFLYYFVRFGFPPLKILRLAVQAYGDSYDEAFIRACLVKFIRRFFASQFKRSCIPDGPKVGSVALSPRGDWRMPSDAVCDEWLRDLGPSES